MHLELRNNSHTVFFLLPCVSEDIQVGCQELRAKRYISDGYCTSIKPIKEVVCAGNCLPIRDLPWYAEFVKVWARKKMREWQCEEDIVKRKRVNLLCRNGSTRQYRIKVVKSCKCKQMNRKHNGTGGKKNYGKVEAAGEGGGGGRGGKGGTNTKPPKKVKDRTRKKEKKRRRRQRRKKKQQEDRGERKGGTTMVVDEELDISSQLNQKQGESAVPRGRKSARKGKRGRKSETNSDTTGGEQDKTQRSEDSEKQARDQALPSSSR
ncbi:fragile X messenger ribonucleoprotein 1 homolog [Littorina saxatilis]|uniref:fragile X messenger ribonucleoprotein 1 homolog n=1 Tax=Littorina saxatilis TaxID=31220 RepID=UPI0038B57729